MSGRLVVILPFLLLFLFQAPSPVLSSLSLLFDSSSLVDAYPPPLSPGDVDYEPGLGPENAVDQDPETTFNSKRKEGAGLIVGPLPQAKSPDFLVVTARCVRFTHAAIKTSIAT